MSDPLRVVSVCEKLAAVRGRLADVQSRVEDEVVAEIVDELGQLVERLEGA